MAASAVATWLFLLALPCLVPDPPPGPPPGSPTDSIDPQRPGGIPQPAVPPPSPQRAQALEAELDRLPRQRVTRVHRDGLLVDYVIDDIAGLGKPYVGRIVASPNGGQGDTSLDLETRTGRRFRLLGPLARPQIAGPGYKVWVIGDLTASGKNRTADPTVPIATLRIFRIGILALPDASVKR